MDTTTGRLVDLELLPELRRDPNYQPVPFYLREEAVRALDGRAEAHVSEHGSNPLSEWRRERMKARRRATAKSSRRRNRRK
jgi:hypothetical protein